MGSSCSSPPDGEGEGEFQVNLPMDAPLPTKVRGGAQASGNSPKSPPPPAGSPPGGRSSRGSWLGRLLGTEREKGFRSTGEALAHLYAEKLLPVEADSDFHTFHSPKLPPAYFSARPLILTLGQYSTGKTTFIKHLIESDYPGQQIGPEPTTDRFVAVCHGDEVQKVPGNALVFDESMPFTPLSAFGNGFLCRLECARVPSPILQGVSFVDTPGVLSGEKQRLKRGYDFEEVIAWFVEHAAMIILFFDAHKLDISDEFKRCIGALSGSFMKVRILLNKADRMRTQQLMRVHGALMWALGKVMETPEVARVYVGSFWDEPLERNELCSLFEEERDDLYLQIQQLPRSSAIQKMNDLSKRARLAKAHALLLEHLRASMPTMWGHAQHQEELIKKLPSVYTEVSREHNVPLGDFPEAEAMQVKLAQQDFSKFSRLDKAKMEKLEMLLSSDIPALLRQAPPEETPQ